MLLAMKSHLSLQSLSLMPLSLEWMLTWKGPTPIVRWTWRLISYEFHVKCQSHNFTETSYELHTKFGCTSHELLAKFIQISNELHVKSHFNFSCEFRMYFICTFSEDHTKQRKIKCYCKVATSAVPNTCWYLAYMSLSIQTNTLRMPTSWGVAFPELFDIYVNIPCKFWHYSGVDVSRINQSVTLRWTQYHSSKVNVFITAVDSRRISLESWSLR